MIEGQHCQLISRSVAWPFIGEKNTCACDTFVATAEQNAHCLFATARQTQQEKLRQASAMAYQSRFFIFILRPYNCQMDVFLNHYNGVV